MSNEELEKLRKKYEQLKEQKSRILTIKKAIEEYEKNPIVKEYLELVQIYKNCTNEIDNDYENKSDNNLLKQAIVDTPICDTNGIYVCMGTFIENEQSNVCRVSRYHAAASYRIYRNLELIASQEKYEVKVSIKECSEFEEKNKVIYPSTSFTDCWYSKLRQEFFEIAINESQEKAIETVMDKIEFQKKLRRIK